MAKIDDLIFKFAFGCAMVDAVGQGAYPHYKKNIKGSDGKRHRIYDGGKYIPTPQNKLSIIYPDIVTMVKELTDTILSGTFTSQKDYNEHFVNVAKDIREYMKNGEYYEFTFGNIQKLINMTLKHIYIIGYNDPAVRERFAYCHCPIDTQIAKRILRIRYVDNSSIFTNGGTLRSSALAGAEPIVKALNSIACSGEVSWSSLNSDEDIQLYLDIQKEICKICSSNPTKYGINSLEFDYFMW